MNIWEVHPALVHFPIALLLSGVTLDLVGWWRANEMLIRVATWMLIAGVSTGLLAANFGLLAFYTVPAHTEAAHRLMYWHMGAASASLLLFIWVLIARWHRRTASPSMPSRVVGLIAAGTLTVAGALGGYIVYHGGAGVAPELLASEVREKHSHGQDQSHDIKGMNREAMVQDQREGMKDMDHGGEGETQDNEIPGMHHSAADNPLQTAKNELSQSGHQEHDAPTRAPGTAAGPSMQVKGQEHKAHEEKAPDPEANVKEQGIEVGGQDAQHEGHEANGKEPGTAEPKTRGKTRESEKLPESPKALPNIPPPDPNAAKVPPGYRVEVVAQELEYPTSIEFDADDNIYVAEGGYFYGDDVALARVLRISADGTKEVVADQLSGPVTDLLWQGGRLFISHRGKISVLEAGTVRDLVTDLPSLGDHHNNQMTIGPDGKLYFGQGTATNSGVVGLDNFKTGWLAKHPTVHDVPAKDIRLRTEERGEGHAQEFEAPDLLAMLADDSEGPTGGQVDQMKGVNDGMEGMNDAVNEQLPDGGTRGLEMPGEVPLTKKDMKGMDHGEKGDMQDKGMSQMKRMQHGAMGAELEMTKTGAFQKFGTKAPLDGSVHGETKANGTILRMNTDGSNLEVYAWGLRNPFGVIWGPDDNLYASDNGYDERGSRPIAHAPDVVWRIVQDGWYGFPDYAAGIPVTDSGFKPQGRPAPEFLMRDHPSVDKPLATLKPHAGVAKIDFSRRGRFGFKGQMFLALAGDMNPITGQHSDRSGFEVVRIDPSSGASESFFRVRENALGPKGMEYIQTAGPKRPVDVRFSPDGDSLYVVDLGAMAIIATAIGPAPRPFPGTGVIWRITRGAGLSR